MVSIHRTLEAWPRAYRIFSLYGMPSLLQTESDDDPYAFYAWLRTEAPVFHDALMGCWLLSRYEDVRAGFADPRLSSEAYALRLEPMMGRTISQMDGPTHTAHRRLVTPAFNGRALQRWREISASIARELVALIDGRAEVELVAEFCRELPVRTMAAVLGLPPSDGPMIQRWTRGTSLQLDNVSQDPEVARSGDLASEALFDYLVPHVEQRRRSPGTDLLSTLCTATIDGEPMSDDAVKGFASLLLAAGTETTSATLATLFTSLIQHPDQLAAVRADPALIPRAWAEAIRHNPPVQFEMRQTTEDVHIGPERHLIPSGSPVALLIGAANRDPARFADPDRFDVSRSDAHVDRAFTAAATHVGFGAGRHFCLGAQLSLIEAEVAVPLLLKALPGPAFADGSNPTFVGKMLRGPEKLLVTTGW